MQPSAPAPPQSMQRQVSRVRCVPKQQGDMVIWGGGGAEYGGGELVPASILCPAQSAKAYTHLDVGVECVELLNERMRAHQASPSVHE